MQPLNALVTRAEASISRAKATPNGATGKNGSNRLDMIPFIKQRNANRANEKAGRSAQLSIRNRWRYM